MSSLHPVYTGQERFGNMTRVYYKEAVGAVIVFDVTRVSTFEAVQKWKQDIDSKVRVLWLTTIDKNELAFLPADEIVGRVYLQDCLEDLGISSEYGRLWWDTVNCSPNYGCAPPPLRPLP